MGASGKEKKIGHDSNCFSKGARTHSSKLIQVNVMHEQISPVPMIQLFFRPTLHRTKCFKKQNVCKISGKTWVQGSLVLVNAWFSFFFFLTKIFFSIGKVETAYAPRTFSVMSTKNTFHPQASSKRVACNCIICYKNFVHVVMSRIYMASERHDQQMRFCRL